VLEHAGFQVRIHALVDLWNCGKLPIKPTSCVSRSLFGFLILGGFRTGSSGVALDVLTGVTSEFFLNVGRTSDPMRQVRQDYDAEVRFSRLGFIFADFGRDLPGNYPSYPLRIWTTKVQHLERIHQR